MQFVPTTEGFYDFAQSQYIYQYKDQLGNVRMSYAKNTSTGVAEVTDQSDYYPFGLKHSNALSINSYKENQYNGKELDYGVMYDYGARFYMPEIGRWGVIDRKAEGYSTVSSYVYALNNPIKYIDPDGKDVVSIDGGIRFIGQDAREIFNSLKSRLFTNGSENSRHKQINETSYCCSDRLQIQDGKKVLEAKESFLRRLWATLEPREWTDPDSGTVYQVKADGTISGIRRIGGAGSLDFIGGQGALKIGEFILNPEKFHRIIKPKILKEVSGKYAHIVGKNPDITVKNGKIILRGAKLGPFKGTEYVTGLDAKNI